LGRGSSLADNDFLAANRGPLLAWLWGGGGGPKPAGRPGELQSGWRVLQIVPARAGSILFPFIRAANLARLDDDVGGEPVGAAWRRRRRRRLGGWTVAGEAEAVGQWARGGQCAVHVAVVFVCGALRVPSSSQCAGSAESVCGTQCAADSLRRSHAAPNVVAQSHIANCHPHASSTHKQEKLIHNKGPSSAKLRPARHICWPHFN